MADTAAALVLPVGVVVVEATSEMFETPALEQEEAALVRPVAKRLREFRSGRHAARAALAALGAPVEPLPMGPRREPRWPEGVVGTIAHCEGFTAAAAAWRSEFAGIGLDAEPDGRVRDHLIGSVMTDTEQRWALGRRDPATALFVVKEAVYKALFPEHGQLLDFRQVEVAEFAVDAASSSFSAEVIDGPLAGKRVSGETARLRGLMLAGAAIPARR